MCDTFVVSLGDGQTWFGKNSDRHPSEPQTLCLIPRRDPAPECLVGNRVFARPDKGLALAVSKPSWMAGAEMGVNEAGVAIGNEAVFSRWKVPREGVLGMDLLRAALGAAESAKEALEFMIAFVEEIGLGGNGAYRGSLYYDNSFLIAGPDGAYVLETAGRRWAWKPAEGIVNISNAYSIEEDYKRLDTQTRKEIAPVNERAACSDEADPGRKGHKESWKALVERPFYLRFSRAHERKAALRAALLAQARPLALDGILSSLRCHGGATAAAAQSAPGSATAASARGAAGMAAPCLHEAGFPVRSSTTASLAFQLRGEGQGVLWFTGTSYPCLSVYKPIILADRTFIPLWTEYDYAEGAESAVERWKKARTDARRAAGQADFEGRRNALERRLSELAERAAAAPENQSLLEECRKAVDAELRAWERSLGLA